MRQRQNGARIEVVTKTVREGRGSRGFRRVVALGVVLAWAGLSGVGGAAVAWAAAPAGAATSTSGSAAAGTGKQRLVVDVPAGPTDQTVTVDQKAGITIVQAKAGLITITYGKIKAFSSRLEYNQKTQKAVLTGDVRVVDAARTITAQRVDVDLRQEQYTFTDKVNMVELEQAPSSGSGAAAGAAAGGGVKAENVKMRLQADSLVYDTRTNLARAEGNVQVQEADRSSAAQKLVYDSARNEIQLEGDVHVATKDGTMTAARVVVNTQTEQIQFFGPTTLQLDVETGGEATSATGSAGATK